jgi:hypothetical protein
MPADYGLWLGDRDRVQNVRAKPVQRHKDEPIPTYQLRSSSHRPAQHIDLMTQYQDFSFEPRPRPKPNSDPVQK